MRRHSVARLGVLSKRVNSPTRAKPAVECDVLGCGMRVDERIHLLDGVNLVAVNARQVPLHLPKRVVLSGLDFRRGDLARGRDTSNAFRWGTNIATSTTTCPATLVIARLLVIV